MKTLLLLGFAALIHVSGYAQGTVNFLTGSGAIISVRCEPGHPPVPAGTAAGPFLAALYFAPEGVTDSNYFMQLGAPAPFVFPGIVVGGTRFTPTPGTFSFQVRAWEVAKPNHVGVSRIFTLTTGNPNANPPTPPQSLFPGLQSFEVGPLTCPPVIPEPSAIALGALGLGVLLVLRPRRHA